MDVVAISRTIGILLFFAAVAIILCIFISACQYTLGKEHVPMENRVVSGDSTINLYQRNDPVRVRGVGPAICWLLVADCLLIAC